MERWDNKLVLEFIELYASYPVLWDPSHKFHKNRNALNEAWDTISQKISKEVSVENLKKKKESLMTTYRTLAKKVRQSTSSDSEDKFVYKPSWFAFEPIHRFLSASGRKMQLRSPEQPQEEFLDLGCLDVEIVEDMENVPSTSKDRDFPCPRGPPKKKIKVQPKEEVNMTQNIKQESEMLSSPSNNRNNLLQDGPELYGQLLASKMRQLSQRSQIILQNKIDNLVFQAQMDEIDSQHVSSINPVPPVPAQSIPSPVPSSLPPESAKSTPNPAVPNLFGFAAS